jgi:hypothetical protein
MRDWRKKVAKDNENTDSVQRSNLPNMFQRIANVMVEIERKKISKSQMGNQTCWFCNSRRREDLKTKPVRYIDDSLGIRPSEFNDYPALLQLPPLYKGVVLPMVQKRKETFPTPCRGPIKEVEWSTLSHCRYLRPALPKYRSETDSSG